MKAPARLLPTALLVGLLPACGLVPAYTAGNLEARAGVPCPPTRARMIGLSDGVFVGIALSGGGSRAANFSAAVLLELEELGFLGTASAISSVSGSSLTAAYYGLFAGDKARWDRGRVREAMVTDFQTDWLLRWFAPHHAVRYWLTDFDRSDIMKRVFDDRLFDGKTFRDMGQGRPRILLNATSRTRAEAFVFTDEAFEALGSCLADYPISEAVMASGAFPAAFEDVTLEDYRRPKEVAGERRRSFTHLYDGGAADNLGLDSLWETMKTGLQESGGARPQRCFFFIVDAYTTPDRPDLEGERDTRKILDYIVNTNVIAAFDALLARRRIDTLWDYGFREGEIGRTPFKVFDLNLWDERGGEWKVPCAAWHLTFDRLRRAGEWGLAIGWDPKTVKEAEGVGSVVNRIRTRYHLAGPRGYSAEELQAALFRAAHLLVREDKESLQKACDWFRQHRLRVCGGP